MINFEIVTKQIETACKTLEITDQNEVGMFIDFFNWYYEKYFEHFKREHKRLTTRSITTAIKNMWTLDEIKEDKDPLELLQELTEEYFDCKFSREIDYAITHFSCPEILASRYYRTY